MGLTTGFTGGVTLTLGIAYLTVLAHERNRQAQAQALRSQSRVLTGLLEPSPLPPPQSRAELAREERSSLVETAKDRWNEEVEYAVRWAQKTDWSEVREGMEGAVGRLLGTGLQKSRDGIEDAEKKAGLNVLEAVDKSKAAAKKGADDAARGIDRAVAATISGAERAGTEAKEGASRIATAAKEKLYQAEVKTADFGQKTKANAQRTGLDARAAAKEGSALAKIKLDHAEAKAVELKDATKAKSEKVVAETKTGAREAAESVRSSGGTVDAARGALRDVVSKGIEKGKDALGKVQEAVGLSQGKPSVLASESSAVERALQDRYKKPDGLNKSVDQTLEERYKPIDARDNTVLRGV